MRQVRNAGQNGAKLALHIVELRLDAFHFFGDGARFGLLRLGLVFFAFAHQRADFLAEAIAGSVQVIALTDQRSAHAVKLGEIVEQRGIEITGGKFFAHEIEILSHKMKIKHNQSFQTIIIAGSGNFRQYALRLNVSRNRYRDTFLKSGLVAKGGAEAKKAKGAKKAKRLSLFAFFAPFAFFASAPPFATRPDFKNVSRYRFLDTFRRNAYCLKFPLPAMIMV